MDVTAEIRQGLELIVEPGAVFEIRALDCRSRPGAPYTFMAAGYFIDIDRAAAAIAEFERSVYTPAIYVTLNPVMPDLLARADHQIKAKIRDTTKDDQIVRRRWLLIDIDPIRPTGISATDDELDAARRLANEIGRYLATLDWPEPIFACSGNGYHLLYRVDLPADDQGLIQRVLAALADRFDAAGAIVDRMVHNQSRIAKVPGTLVRKGDEIIGQTGMADRPHRRSSLIYAPDALTPVTIEQLEAICGTPQPAITSAPDNGRFPATPDGVQAWLEARGVVVKGRNRKGNSTLLLLERCPINPAIESTGRSDIAVIVDDDGKLGYANKHNRAAGYTWQDVRDALDPGRGSFSEATDVDLSQFRCGNFVVEPAPAIEIPEPQESLDRSDPGPLPDRLLDVPGFIGEVMAYNLETAPRPQPVLALAGALVLQAVLAGRKIRDHRNNRTNLFVVSLAESGDGKGHARKVNRKILFLAGAAQLEGPSKLASDAGVVSALREHPARLFQVDEFGRYLETYGDARRNPHLHGIMTTLMELYSEADTQYSGKAYADVKKNFVVDQPCLCLHAVSAKASFEAALTPASLTDGSLARLLVFEPIGESPDLVECEVPDPPDGIIAHARAWAEFALPGNLSAEHPQPPVALCTPEAREIFANLRRLADGERRAATDWSRAVWARTEEQACRLALVYACSQVQPKLDSDMPVVDNGAATWACDLAQYLTRRLLWLADSCVSKTEFGKLQKAILRRVREAGGRIDRRRLLRSMQHVRRAERDEALETLKEAGLIVEDKASRGDNGGRPSHWYKLVTAGDKSDKT